MDKACRTTLQSPWLISPTSAAASEQTDSTIAERRKPKAGTTNNVNATKMKNIGDELILEICASLSPHYNEIFVGTMTVPEALQNIEV